jgi:hypothetical protein
MFEHPLYHQYNIIIIYDTWFHIDSPEDYERLGWIKMAELKIKDNVICASDTVSFFISDHDMINEFGQNLLLFKKTLPMDVSLSVFYNDEEEAN